jgi:hypothetical protein
MNCQMFSTGLSSGDSAVNGIKETLPGLPDPAPAPASSSYVCQQQPLPVSRSSSAPESNIRGVGVIGGFR